jgi:5-methylcytosine-specific restriction endonuclease McrA
MKCTKCGVELIIGKNITDNMFKQGKRRCKTCRMQTINKRKDNYTFEQRLRNKINSCISNHRCNGVEVIGTTDEYLKTYSDKCNYCGNPINIFSSNIKESGSLDRINNSIMSPNDIQWLCHDCNLMKNKLSHDEFIEKIKLILERGGHND